MPGDNGLTAYASLGADINKIDENGEETLQDGVVSGLLPELELDMKNGDIIKLTDKWEKSWVDSPKKTEWEKAIKENERYWLGIQFDGPKADKTRAMVDNLIFESLETYLPQATRRNPEPLVELTAGQEETEVRLKFVQRVKDKLADVADENKLRLKMKKAARHWAIYHLGVGKIGWDLDRDMPILRIIRPKKIILDPEATIDEDGYTGNRIGEYRKMEAGLLKNILEKSGEPGAKAYIDTQTKGEDGTEIQFKEWWTPEYMCWTLNKEVLLKKKNPHWNWDTTVKEESVDDYGNTTMADKEKVGNNHFKTPKMPFIFLSVFNLGDQPMDNTSLIQQNLSNQDLINKRNRQIDKNADSMNGGMVVSLERSGLTKEQAAEVTRALNKGGVVAIPTGTPRDAVDRFPTQGLPGDVYNQLIDIRGRLRDIFGVKGSSQAGLSSEDTVRGKIISRSLDTDRIGGGVTEYLEQFADDVYNWFLQMLYVYDNGFQFIEGVEVPSIIISVKEGSLLPKDSISIANQAIELSAAGKMSTVDLYKRLEYPNPEDLAANAWLEVNAPQILFRDNPLVQQALAMQQQAAVQEAQMGVAEEAGRQRVQAIGNTAEDVAEQVLDEVPTNQTPI